MVNVWLTYAGVLGDGRQSHGRNSIVLADAVVGGADVLVDGGATPTSRPMTAGSRAPIRSRLRCGRSAGPRIGRGVAVEDLAAVGAVGFGGAVGVEDELPASSVDADVVLETVIRAGVRLGGPFD